MVAVKKDSTKNMAKKKASTAKSKSTKGKKSAAKADALVAGNAHLKTTLQQIEKQFGEDRYAAR